MAQLRLKQEHTQVGCNFSLATLLVCNERYGGCVAVFGALLFAADDHAPQLPTQEERDDAEDVPGHHGEAPAVRAGLCFDYKTSCE